MNEGTRYGSTLARCWNQHSLWLMRARTVYLYRCSLWISAVKVSLCGRAPSSTSLFTILPNTMTKSSTGNVYISSYFFYVTCCTAQPINFTLSLLTWHTLHISTPDLATRFFFFSPALHFCSFFPSSSLFCLPIVILFTTMTTNERTTGRANEQTNER
jgi:hypothetical protein